MLDCAGRGDCAPTVTVAMVIVAAHAVTLLIIVLLK
jgi:hypothetical protein